MILNKFIVYYSSILFFLFQAHKFFFEFSEANSDLIYRSYIFFYLFSILFFLFIYLKIKTKTNAPISTIFFVGSTIKLFIFFFIFRPILYQINFTEKLGISIFLVPYIFSSVFIIYGLSRLLGDSN